MRRWAAMTVALVLALGLAVWTGLDQSWHYGADPDAPPTRGAMGQPVRIGASTATVTLLGFQAASSFPNPKDPAKPVTMTPGAVGVLLDLQFDHGREDAAALYCTVRLVQREPVAREWSTTASDILWRARPDAPTSCRATGGSQSTMAVAFMIPAEAVDHVAVRVTYGSQGTVEISR